MKIAKCFKQSCDCCTKNGGLVVHVKQLSMLEAYFGPIVALPRPLKAPYVLADVTARFLGEIFSMKKSLFTPLQNP